MSNAIVQISPAENLGKNRKLVRAVLGGKLEADDIKLIRAWAEGLSETVQRAAKGLSQSVCILVDIHGFENYSDPEIIMILTELMRKDNPFVYKTATFGGNALHEMVEGVIRGLSQRQNLDNFKTEEEALVWLKE